jgi:hypothetical protein
LNRDESERYEGSSSDVDPAWKEVVDSGDDQTVKYSTFLQEL